MSYQAIENYGIIGNMRPVALVGMNGWIDWYCYPQFDSPSIFGAILDDKKGGRFQISADADGVRHKQFYWPSTNVLVTRFLLKDGIVELEDFMPAGLPSDSPDYHHIYRPVRCVRGAVRVWVACRPATDCGRQNNETLIEANGARFKAGRVTLALSTTVPLSDGGQGGVSAEFVLNEGQSQTFILGENSAGDGAPTPPSEKDAEELLRDTVKFWHGWLSACTYHGRWRDQVHRSALALKLLTFEPTGAVISAPTTSLPEGIGGVRNWDYRYTWMRDAAFTVYAFLRVGFTEEAARFKDWLTARWKERDSHSDGPLQLMYAVDGRSDLAEEELTHLDGYAGSRPVRVGNAAHGQLQLDIYGELMDAVYLFNKYAAPVGYDGWRRLRDLVDWVAGNWGRPDEGIWEVRGGRRHFVYSQVMC